QAGAEEAERERRDAEAETEARQRAKAEADAQARVEREMRSAERAQPRTRTSRRTEKSMLEQVTGSSAFREMARTAGREIVRSIFGTARRRR
ncbi:MAG TPA: helicase HerA-like domain-containing protein, partial [Propionibacteriaceae bacterium]|nr:helicase HerA-like domain-containing protein [Propionibacteriaceae bacterium]